MINIVAQSGKGETTLGLYAGIADPSMAEIAALAGVDFIRLDCEHTLVDPSAVARFVIAADAADIPVHIRVSSSNDITRMLDCGARGIVVPGVRNKEEAQRAVSLVKYAPLGERGMASIARSLKFGETPFADYLKTANNETCLAIQIESREGLENLDEILSVEGVDMISTGKLDLSQALGVPGQAAHPDVLAAEEMVIAKTLEHGKIPTMLTPNPERAAAMRARGVCCLTLFYDTKFILQSFKAQVARYREILAGQA